MTLPKVLEFLNYPEQEMDKLPIDVIVLAETIDDISGPLLAEFLDDRSKARNIMGLASDLFTILEAELLKLGISTQNESNSTEATPVITTNENIEPIVDEPVQPSIRKRGRPSKAKPVYIHTGDDKNVSINDNKIDDEEEYNQLHNKIDNLEF